METAAAVAADSEAVLSKEAAGEAVTREAAAVDTAAAGEAGTEAGRNPDGAAATKGEEAAAEAGTTAPSREAGEEPMDPKVKNKNVLSLSRP